MTDSSQEEADLPEQQQTVEPQVEAEQEDSKLESLMAAEDPAPAESSSVEDLPADTQAEEDDREGSPDADPDAIFATAEEQVGLDARAIAAAHAAIDAGNKALLEVQESAKLMQEGQAQATKETKKQMDPVMVLFLLMNIGLMVALLVLPSSDGKTDPAPLPDDPPVAVGPEEDPFAEKPVPIADLLPDRRLYSLAMIEGGRGNTSKAIDVLMRYLREHRNLSPMQKRMVYASLASYLSMEGRSQEAREYQVLIDQATDPYILSKSLWSMALMAEKDGRGADVRRYLARYLLQQNQLSPEERTHSVIAEAYLKIADSYRLHAEMEQEPAEDAGKEKGE